MSMPLAVGLLDFYWVSDACSGTPAVIGMTCAPRCVSAPSLRRVRTFAVWLSDFRLHVRTVARGQVRCRPAELPTATAGLAASRATNGHTHARFGAVAARRRDERVARLFVLVSVGGGVRRGRALRAVGR